MEIKTNLYFLIFIGQFKTLLSYSANYKLEDGEEFDFIVVGSGIGGCTAASRLAESGRYSVLLIEAGGYPHPNMDIPAFALPFQSDPEYSVTYQSVPQVNAAISQGGIVNFTTGRVVGGASAFNGMFLNRGSPYDFDNWRRLSGDSSWGYKSMLKYFIKMENYSGSVHTDQRGYHGPVSVEQPTYAPGQLQWLQAGVELGYGIADPNGPQRISFAPGDRTQKRGRRVSAYNAYIEPLLHTHANLHLLVNTQVNKVIFEEGRAVAVEFTSSSTKDKRAKTRKEIILSGGVIGSPLLLMKSGIGPKKVLDQIGVEPVKYLPVGENLIDQVSAGIPIILGNKSLVVDPARDLTPANRRIFDEQGEGPFTSYFGTGPQAFLTSSLNEYERLIGWPNIHLVAGFLTLPVRNFGAVPNYNIELKENEVLTRWGSFVGRPKSRGRLYLKDVEGLPILDFRYFSEPDDVRVIVDGIKTLLEVCEKTKAFRQIRCRLADNVLPPCRHFIFRSDAYWDCYVRHVDISVGTHAGGTCKMGRKGDPEAVVDTKLKVFGIENLRVVDASIMPMVTNANTQAPVYAIGEKAADMILKEMERVEVTHSGWSRYRVL